MTDEQAKAIFALFGAEVGENTDPTIPGKYRVAKTTVAGDTLPDVARELVVSWGRREGAARHLAVIADDEYRDAAEKRTEAIRHHSEICGKYRTALSFVPDDEAGDLMARIEAER